MSANTSVIGGQQFARATASGGNWRLQDRADGGFNLQKRGGGGWSTVKQFPWTPWRP